MIDAAARIVFTSGLVYSQQFPFSTSLIVDGGRIAWIGDDAGLSGQLLESDVQIDCAGALITPAFFDANLTDLPGADPAVAAGFWSRGDDLKLVTRIPSGGWSEVKQSNASMGANRVVVSRVLPHESVEAMLSHRQFAVVPPNVDAEALVDLARAGVPFTFGSFGRPDSPWNWIRHAVYSQPDGLSARAAFNAATRSGWRLAGSPDAGALIIGTRPSMCVWKCEHVQVQVPDSRVRAWSTDVRAGTPPLPDLSPGAALPELIATVIDGEYRNLR